MTTQDFMIILLCTVDQEMLHIPKRPDATLYSSAVVPLALLYALKGGGTRAFYRWLRRDSQALFPQVPKRTRLCRLFKTHTAWTAHCLAAPTVLGVADTYGIAFIEGVSELLRSIRGRSPAYTPHRSSSTCSTLRGLSSTHSTPTLCLAGSPLF
jgi:hypothetical protein